MGREPVSDIRELGPTARTRPPSRALGAIAAVAVIGLGFWVLGGLIDGLLLVFAGVLFAVFLRGLAGWLSRHTPLPERWSLAVVGVAILALLGVSAWLIAPSLAAQFDELIARVPEAAARLGERLERYAWGRSLLEDFKSFSASDAIQPQRAFQGATSLLSSTVGLSTSFLLFLFLGIFLAVEPRIYRRGVLRLVPIARRARAAAILDETGQMLGQWLIGKFISMAVIGVLTWIGLKLLGMPIALALAVLAATLSFIPYVGPLLALLPAALVGLLQGPAQAGYVIALYLGIQLVESNLLTPLVQRHTTSLPPAITIVGQVVMGALTGALGVVLATPLTAALLVLVKRIYVEDLLGDASVDDGEAPLAEAGDATPGRAGSG